ncbi:Uncharacterized protein FWK35_00009964 [Aphis craccivora]|uniref:Uncharacterized protein n=1 Tax=Aphis craccivora TaxID=307492 RepID=A0A6G0YFT9_APHCR|nr:Uncharacterized protein FWK35_00009964 [Aphis craccivora]
MRQLFEADVCQSTIPNFDTLVTFVQKRVHDRTRYLPIARFAHAIRATRVRSLLRRKQQREKNNHRQNAVRTV